jgi:hypothetical protein
VIDLTVDWLSIVLGEMMTPTQALKALMVRLTARGVAAAYIPALMRDVFQVMVKGGLFTVPLVNSQLQQQGWDSEVLDEASSQLITNILESEWGYGVRHYHLD